ncbi:hypothetical protein ACF3MZ_02905 [Paenibacillaceae bacterium WGS1546]|uniref:hypothetical protein n=1 Tax=Cohnella sp. WGS1546 TaxID=3366810 RepID=UPI00372D4EF0
MKEQPQMTTGSSPDIFFAIGHRRRYFAETPSFWGSFGHTIRYFDKEGSNSLSSSQIADPLSERSGAMEKGAAMGEAKGLRKRKNGKRNEMARRKTVRAKFPCRFFSLFGNMRQMNGHLGDYGADTVLLYISIFEVISLAA